LLLSGGPMLLGGRASDLAGRRRVFAAGLALFAAASLASGLAPTAGALIAARAGPGLGAALLTPAALSIVTTTYTGGIVHACAGEVRAGRVEEHDAVRILTTTIVGLFTGQGQEPAGNA